MPPTESPHHPWPEDAEITESALLPWLSALPAHNVARYEAWLGVRQAAIEAELHQLRKRRKQVRRHLARRLAIESPSGIEVDGRIYRHHRDLNGVDVVRLPSTGRIDS